MTMAASDKDPRNLHDLALDAQTDVQKLAVGLAHAGANPNAIQGLQQMAHMLSQIVKALGSGPSLDQGANPQGPPPGQPQAAPPQAQQQAPQAAPQPAAAQGEQEPAQAKTLHAAAHALHRTMQAAAQTSPR